MTIVVNQDRKPSFEGDGSQLLGEVLETRDVDLINRWFDEMESSGNVPAGYEPEFEAEGGRLRKLRRLLWMNEEVFGPVLCKSGFCEEALERIGPSAVVVFSAAFLKPGQVGTAVAPHQDQALWRRTYPKAFSFWVALSDVSPDNGGLHGYLGQRRTEVVEHRSDAEHAWHPTLSWCRDELGERYEFNLAPGEAAMWDSFFVHGSGANTSPVDRRGMVFVATEGGQEWLEQEDSVLVTDILARWAGAGEKEPVS
ncbi:phytanoyl-CoA dioxygenase family protein [Nocardioides bruguierae]|uniref:Phytanoyl-CoA dioxygenase family protein n=1 Tax=Nocardioides bruguierae TaxID=2945102 RepID=A0A9X2DBB3_9ACTN|nr:phytanoyl-CoA dioxygenase family protein [Nocardioides bruguierae]MCM0622621.1 phytanoyl-CoA dioxygenase family protein [Nocardioides bruguierae]